MKENYLDYRPKRRRAENFLSPDPHQPVKLGGWELQKLISDFFVRY
jgi:hypothetical protein